MPQTTLVPLDLTDPTAARLDKILKTMLGEQVFHPEDSLENTLGMDSMDKVEFAMEVEEEFDILSTDEVSNTLLTVGAWLTYLKTQQH